MNETEFHHFADATIISMLEALEEIDETGDLDVEYASGILTVALPGGKQLVISKHAPSRQIWLSSPLSGGLHFHYIEGKWVLPDGRSIQGVLTWDLQKLANLEVAF